MQLTENIGEKKIAMVFHFFENVFQTSSFQVIRDFIKTHHLSSHRAFDLKTIYHNNRGSMQFV